jgi:hypothetical protein
LTRLAPPFFLLIVVVVEVDGACSFDMVVDVVGVDVVVDKFVSVDETFDDGVDSVTTTTTILSQSTFATPLRFGGAGTTKQSLLCLDVDKVGIGGDCCKVAIVVTVVVVVAVVVVVVVVCGGGERGAIAGMGSTQIAVALVPIITSSQTSRTSRDRNGVASETQEPFTGSVTKRCT